MRRGPLLSVCAFAALTAGVGSCGTTSSSSVSTKGTTLTIYASPPLSPAWQDIAAAEKLAFQQFRGSGGRVGKFTIKFVQATSGKPSGNARTAIGDSSTIAYIGELQPGASADSMGITNAQDVLQVSPTDTAVELTQATNAVPGAPGDYYESAKTYGRTFARVVPNSSREVQAQAQEMSSLNVKKLYVTGDGTPYGAAAQDAMRHAAAKAGIAVVSSPAAADGAFYGGVSARAASTSFTSLVAANQALKLFAPSALALDLPQQSHNVYVSTPGFLPSKLSAAGRKFVSDFAATYGHDPGPEAIFGYEAVNAVLSVLREAGANASDRSTVVRDFFAIRNRPSPLGTYSIDSAGDTSIAPFVFSRLRNGALAPFVQRST